jgi:hypothetical protein
MGVVFKAREMTVKVLHGGKVFQYRPVLCPGTFSRCEDRDSGRIGEDAGCDDTVPGFRDRYVLDIVPDQFPIGFCIADGGFRQDRVCLLEQFAHPVLFFELVHLVGKAL